MQMHHANSNPVPGKPLYAWSVLSNGDLYGVPLKDGAKPIRLPRNARAPLPRLATPCGPGTITMTLGQGLGTVTMPAKRKAKAKADHPSWVDLRPKNTRQAVRGKYRAETRGNWKQEGSGWGDYRELGAPCLFDECIKAGRAKTLAAPARQPEYRMAKLEAMIEVRLACAA